MSPRVGEPDNLYREYVPGFHKAGTSGGQKARFMTADYCPIDDGIPDRFELFILGDGEQKVEIHVDSRFQNCNIFRFNREDHTLANVLTARINMDERVIFAAYKVPHPLFPTFDLRVQTQEGVTPKEVVIKACKAIIRDLSICRNNFTREWELRRMVEPRQE